VARGKSAGVDLDDWQSFGKVDRSDLLGRVEAFALDMAEGWAAARMAAPSFRKGGRFVSSVIVAGMGGSAISGEVVADAFRPAMAVPMLVVQDYALPAFARRETLVVVSSYSGSTEETLAMFEDAVKRGCRVVGVTSGGELKKRLRDEGLPCFPLPPGIQPRAAMPFLLPPVVEALARVELAAPAAAMDEAIAAAAGVVRACRRERPTRSNRAKRMARALAGGTPVVFAEGVLRAAALRWRTQFNENPKIIAREDAFPASNHNDINAWVKDARAKHFRAVLLRDPGAHPRSARRAELTKKIALKGNAGAVLEYEASGKSALARAVSAIVMGDLVSVYLAIQLGVDPTPVDIITRLKAELAKPQAA
jgi:glucose/mannose-6-phosphate isomerase